MLFAITKSNYDAAPVMKKLLVTHNLNDLANNFFNAIADVISLDSDVSNVAQVFKSCVSELALYDEGSYSFRYSIDKNLKPSLTALEAVDIDLYNFKATTDKMTFVMVTLRRFVEDRIAQAEVRSDYDEDRAISALYYEEEGSIVRSTREQQD